MNLSIHPIQLTSRSAPAPGVRFGAGADHMSAEAMDQAGQDFYRAFKMAESLPGKNPGENGILAFLEKMMGPDMAAGAKLRQALQKIEEMHSQQNRSCEPVRDDNQMIIGTRIKCGVFEKIFKHRRDIQSTEQITFPDYLKKHFGENQRIIVAFTGWTKPPAEFLQQDPILRARMNALKKEQWPQFAEEVYVNMIKAFLRDLIASLKAQAPGFNPATDLGFIYGVTPEGVDRAVEEFCQETGIKLAGLSCYDWVKYIPDEAGKPPVFLGKDPAEFGKLMSDGSNKIVVVGGRSYAANISASGESQAEDRQKVAIDLMAGRGINVPALALADDNRSTIVLNAAKALKTSPGCNPEEWRDIVDFSRNSRGDSKEVFILSQVMKSALYNLYACREIKLDEAAS